MSNDTKSCWKDRRPFTSEDNKEAMTKAFELFSYCMAAGPCNNCAFSDWNTPGIECKIGWPNNWSLFDPNTKEGSKNRKLILDILDRKEKKNAKIS